MVNPSGLFKKLTLAILLALLVACNPSKQFITDARKAENQGNAEEAANLYYNVLLQYPNQKEAMLGLAVNGQKVLSDKFARFSKFVIDNDIDNAIQTYLNAQAYFNNAAKVQVKLDWPVEYDEIFIDVRKDHLTQKFDYAVQLIQQKKFENAERVFEQMAKLDTAFSHVSVLRLNTVLEPIYQKGLVAYQQANYKEAYFLFDKVVSMDDGFKDAMQYRKLSQQKATQLFGILPVYYALPQQQTDFDLLNVLADKLALLEGKYLRIANLNQLHKELEARGFVNLKQASQAIEAAKATGLSYGLLIKLDTFLYQTNPSSILQKEAYEAITENILNPYTKTYQSITRFKKVNYTVKTEGQQCTLGLTYFLVDAKTGTTMITKHISYTERDEIHAATYNGNPANIYPTLPDDNYLPQVTQEWHDMFFAPRKDLLQKGAFLSFMLEKVAKQISNEVGKNLK